MIGEVSERRNKLKQCRRQATNESISLSESTNERKIRRWNKKPVKNITKSSDINQHGNLIIITFLIDIKDIGDYDVTR